MTPKQLATIVQLADQGLPLREIGRKVGLSHTSVRNALKVARGAATPPSGVAAPASGVPAVAPAAAPPGKSSATRPHFGRPRPAESAFTPPVHAGATPAEPDPTPGDLLGVLRSLQQSAIDASREARDLCDFRAMQKLLRDAAGLAPVIARLEKVSREDTDLYRISRSDIATGLAGYRERVRILLSRPLTCAHCGRQISIAWGEGDE